MKLILTSYISNLGKIGDVVEVKNGYAKNFLIPNKKAISFTPNNQKIFEAKKVEFEKINENSLKEAEKIRKELLGKDIIIIESASDDGRLYGSVSSMVIAGKVNDVLGSKSVARSNVFLHKPIKEIGIYHVKLSLHSEASFDVRLIVTRSESEIDALLKAAAKGNKNSDEVVGEVAQSNIAVEAVDGEEKPAKPKKPRKKKE